MHGLRQWDPLSPMLFVIVMDALNSFFIAASHERLLSQFRGAPPGCRASFYADDVVVFLKPTVEDCTILLDLLDLFGEASGLCSNILKTLATPILVALLRRFRSLFTTFACPVKEFPILYLGAPLSISKLRRQDFQPILDKMDRKLAVWRAGMLSRDGRLVPFKSVLSGIPVHTLLAIDTPKKFGDAINKKQRSFFLKGQTDAQRGHCAVAWAKVCLLTRLEGLV